MADTDKISAKTADIDDIIAKINALPEGDAKKAALDAFKRILGGKIPPLPPLPGKKPKEIEVDPDLEDPEDEFQGGSGYDDTSEDEIDDPDNLLKPKKSGDPVKDSDKPDLTDDSSKDESGEDTDEEESEESGEDLDDILDDIDPAGIYDDPAERETKEATDFEHKLKKARMDTLIDQIEEQADTTEKKELIEKARELLDKLDPDMPSDEFDKKCGEIQAILDKVGKVEYVPDDEIEAGITTLKKVHSDPSIASKLKHEIEDNRLRDPEYKKRIADKAEKERYDALVKKSMTTKLASIAEFKKDLTRALQDQIDDCIAEYEEDTYAKENRQHDEDDMVSPGIRFDEIPDESKPSIAIYFDQSGSWDSSDVTRGMEAIADLFALEKKYPELLIVNPPMYFSEILSTDREAARRKGAEECWDWVIQDIMAPPKTKNVIIMTDSDIGHDWGHAGHHGCRNGIGTTVDGCVWFLWKDGSRVPEAAAKLNGRKGTFQYIIR